MTINNTLLAETIPYLQQYGCYEEEVKRFLLIEPQHFRSRQTEAIRLIEAIMNQHGKKALFLYVAQLAAIEYKIRHLQPHLRDHVVHAFLSFILGIYLNEKFIKPRLDNPVDSFQWQLAGLLHDVGYPVQVSMDMLIPFLATVNAIRETARVSGRISFQLIPHRLERLSNRRGALLLIQEQLNRWGLHINVVAEYRRMIHSGQICHGIISSLAVLNVIDALYQMNNPRRVYENVYQNTGDINWNQLYFDKDIVPACSAIYIHNLPTRCFTESKIELSKAPLAFLLKLADSLQQWERPSLHNRTGFASSDFDIDIENGQLILHTTIPEDLKIKIRNEISEYLIEPCVEVR
jgi:hypothetical protein